jgi:hypothetical protein
LGQGVAPFFCGLLALLTRALRSALGLYEINDLHRRGSRDMRALPEAPSFELEQARFSEIDKPFLSAREGSIPQMDGEMSNRTHSDLSVKEWLRMECKASGHYAAA